MSFFTQDCGVKVGMTTNDNLQELINLLKKHYPVMLFPAPYQGDMVTILAPTELVDIIRKEIPDVDYIRNFEKNIKKNKGDE